MRISTFLALLATLALPNTAQDRPGAPFQFDVTPSPPRAHAPTLDARDEGRFDTSPLRGVGNGTTEDGAPVLVGPGYRMVFGPRVAAFHPALGAAAPTTQELTFELLEVRAGGSLLAEAGGVLSAEGTRVQYRHAGGLLERYEARADGVEQSFVVPTRPATPGDLVVRGRLTTSMRAVALDDPLSGLAFELPGVGGVRLGAVTGVAADGATAAGTLRFDGTFVEYVLPASFVAEAAYPLVVDPLIGTTTVLGDSPAQRDERTDVASNGSTFLATWDVRYAADDFDVHAVVVNGDGSAAEFVRAIRVTIGSTSRAPSVGHVDWHNAYVVAWEEGTSPTSDLDIYARVLTVQTFPSWPAVTLSPSRLIAGSTLDERAPAVGGDSLESAGGALVVWADETIGVRVAKVTPNGASTPSLGTAQTVFAGADFRDPTITKSGGAAGRYLIAAERWYATPVPGDHDLFYRIASRNLSMLIPEQNLVTVGPDDQQPSAAGDGDTFALVWQLDPPGSTPFYNDRDVIASQIALDGSILHTTGVATDPNTDAYNPTAAWAGDRTAVAWTDRPSSVSGSDIAFTSLCNDSFAVCDFTSYAGTTANTLDLDPALASHLSGAHGVQSSNGLLTWVHATNTLGTDTTTQARPFSAFGPWSTSNLGGGCGTPMAISIHGPSVVGNSQFEWAIDVQTSASSLLVMNAKPNAGAPWVCGPCALQLDIGILQFLSPVLGGFSDVFSTPIPGDPNLYGLGVTTQFFAIPSDSAPCPSLGTLAASDRIFFTIGF